MNSRKWEVNGQKTANSAWESVTVRSAQEAEQTAQTMAKMGWVNVNWRAEHSSTETQAAWVVRNGRKV